MTLMARSGAQTPMVAPISAPAAVATCSIIAKRRFVNRLSRWIVEPITEFVATAIALAPMASF